MNNKKQKYSSETVRLLIENTKWNFWSPDWSKKIIVQWDCGRVHINKLKKQVRALLGCSQFIYERSLSPLDYQYVVTPKGVLIDLENAMYEQSL